VLGDAAAGVQEQVGRNRTLSSVCMTEGGPPVAAQRDLARGKERDWPATRAFEYGSPEVLCVEDRSEPAPGRRSRGGAVGDVSDARVGDRVAWDWPSSSYADKVVVCERGPATHPRRGHLRGAAGG
jgi:hypothetical protein